MNEILHFLTTRDAFTNFNLICTLSNPKKHDDALMDAYVSFELYIELKNNEPSYAQSERLSISNRRRFSHFDWLRCQLMAEHPTLIIPALPERPGLSHGANFNATAKAFAPNCSIKSEYLERFSEKFVEKRRILLERFIRNVLAHPVLSKSENVRKFLTDDNCISLNEKRNIRACKNLLCKNVHNKLQSVLGNAANEKDKTITENFKTERQSIDFFISNMKEFCTSTNRMQKAHEKYGKKLWALNVALDRMTDLSENRFPEYFSLLQECFATEAEDAEKTVDVCDKGLLLTANEHLLHFKNARNALENYDQLKNEEHQLQKQLQDTTYEREYHSKGIQSVRSNRVLTLYHRAIDTLKGISAEQSTIEKIAKADAKIEDLLSQTNSIEEINRQRAEILASELTLLVDGSSKALLKEELLQLAKLKIDTLSEKKQRWEALLNALSQD